MPPIVEPVLPEPEPMAWQPPADANTLSDFTPPDAITTTVPVDLPGGSITATLLITPTGEFPVLPEGYSFPEGNLPESPITPTLPVSATIELNGLLTNVVSFDQGQVAVVIEEETVSDNAELQFTALPVATYPLTATNTLSNPLETRFLTRFEVEVVEDGQVVEAFEKPVRLVIDLRSLVADLNPAYTGNFFLAYQDENDPTLWHDVPITIHQAEGLISAEVTHFSTWASGSRPEYWKPTFTPPTVSEFSGAATYNYPIEIPPGRNGLQPGIGLSYSSRALDGLIHDTDAGEIAHGWSLSEISISRTGIKYSNLGNQNGPQYLVHPDTFSLVLNGTSYELYPDGTTTNPEVRYYAKDAPGLFIKRYYDASSANVPNTDGLYWVVITSEGTLYRLGFTADSEKWQQAAYSQVSGHQGRNNSISAMAWYADTVTDPFGNQMQYTYYTHNILENIYWVDSDGYDHYWVLTTQNVRINTISYNYPTRVTTLPPTNLTARLSTTPASRIEFRKPIDGSWDNNTDPVENIYIYHNSTQPIKEYRITSTVEMVVSTACINYDPDPDVGRATHTRVVTAIQQFANTDNNPLTLDGWGLPATTFSYASKAHFLKNGGDCSSFRYLSQVNNGYGGSTSFTYSRDDRAVGAYIPDPVNYGVYQWPDIGFNYFVTEVNSQDGRGNSYKTTYSYTAPCYGQWDTGYVGGMSGATVCTSSGAPQLGNIVGFATATRTAYDGTTALNRTITTFGQTVGSNLGRPTQIDVGRMNNSTFVLLGRTVNSYHAVTFGPNLNFIYTSQTMSYQYQDGNTANYLSTKTEYAYDTAYQGGAQYGNLTHIYEYDTTDANATPYRTTYRVYYPNTGVTSGSNWYWNVNRVAAEGVYAGNSTALADLLRGVWTYYDGSSSLTGVPTKGAVTRIRQFGKDPSFTCSQLNPPVSGCSTVYRTTESVMAYDAYGNQEYLYQADDYGRLVFNSSGSLLSDLTATTTDYTLLDYENTYNLYPISVTDAAGYITTFQVYGFNGAALDGFQEQTGLLKQVTAPNNTTTKYEYDPFGRLFAVYDGYNFTGFSNTTVYDGDPVERYRYWDTDWNYNGVTFLDPSGADHQGVPTPFLISIEKRPGSYYLNPVSSSNTGVAYDDQTFYDGFGRPIQTRSLWNWVEGQNLSREIISHTTYGANGQVNCQSIPYDVPFYSDQPKTWPTSPFYTTTTCTSQPHTTTTYDALGRPLTVTAPDASTTNYSYYILTTLTADGRNRLALTNIEDANDHLIGQVTNSLGQLVIVQENSGTGTYIAQSRTWYTYDLLGNLTKVVTSDGDPSTNPTGNDILRQSTMSYDSLGRKTSMTDADMGSWSYSYDVAGNLISQVDAKGQRLCFTYDTLGRLTHKRHDSNNNGCSPTDTQLALYAYYPADAIDVGERGQIEEIRWTTSNTQNKERFHYDNLGRLTNHVRWIDNRQYTMLYSDFDAFHRPHTTTYPNGQTVTTEFDRQGENSLVNGGTTLISNIRTNALGQLTFLDRANGGADTAYSYYTATDDPTATGTGDSNFRLKTIQHGGSGGTWPDFTYEYDLVGDITKLTTTSSQGTDTQTFTYDFLNRLMSAEATGGIANYSHKDIPPVSFTGYHYDILGNLTSYGGSSTYNYLNWHANCTPTTQPMPHAVKKIGSQYFCYDANGNMTTRYTGSTTYTQNFNVENELESVVVSSQTTSFTYDAAGLRVKTVQPNGTTTDTPFPGYEVENPGSSQTVRITFTIAGQAVALRVITSSSNTTYHLYNDHLGSLAAIGNSSGSLVSGSRATYQPFGSYRGTTPTQTLTDRHYTSQKENLELGLYYYNARYYAPGFGRFITADTLIPDPQNPQSFNRYSYTRNNPINRIDPSGHLDNCAALGDLNDMQGCESSPPSVVSSNPLPSIPTGPMVTFTGCDTCVWTDEEMATIQESAVVTGTRLAETLNASHYGWNLSAEQAFLLVYGGSVNFRKTGETCSEATGAIGCWGKTFLLDGGNHEIEVYTDATSLAGDVHWAVHEFGHAFVNEILGGSTAIERPITWLQIYQNMFPTFPNRPDGSAKADTWGFASGRWEWQRSDQGMASEEFADMYLGWVYNQWEASPGGGWTMFGQARASFMNTYMPMWVEMSH